MIVDALATFILLHVNPLLGNNCETNNQTTASKQQQRHSVFCVVCGEML
jgi:hypothetical protein